MNTDRYALAEKVFIVLSAGLVLSLLTHGPGCDGDFPGHLRNGLAYFSKGEVPGGWPPFPFMAILHGALGWVSGGPSILLNLFTFACSVLSVFVFQKIVRLYQQEGMEVAVLSAVAFMAVHPIFVVASATWGDYAISLCLILCAWLCLLKGELAGAAALAGLAVGTRISNCVWILPFTVIALRRYGARRALGFFLTATLVGGLLLLPSLAKIGFNIGIHDGGRGSEAQPLLGAAKSALSKILGFIGLPTLLVTLFFCRKEAYHKTGMLMRRFPELPMALVLEYLVFLYLPSDPGYIISTLPVIALLLPQPRARAARFAQVATVFAMNFIVLDLQNTIPTKLHLSHGYYTAEYTCHETTTPLEGIRFSLPRRPDGGLYFPVGDWTEDARPRAAQ